MSPPPAIHKCFLQVFVLCAVNVGLQYLLVCVLTFYCGHYYTILFVPKRKVNHHNVTVLTDLCPHNMMSNTRVHTHTQSHHEPWLSA